MDPPSGRYVRLSLLAGALWGMIGLALAGQILGVSVWGGVLAAPAVGLAVAIALTHRLLGRADARSGDIET